MPTVPISYVRLMLALAAERGVPQASVLQGVDCPEELLHNPDARIPLRPGYADICRRALALSGEPALGYEFGLRASLTTHGMVGFGVMSQATLRQVLAFGTRFGPVLRLPAWNLHVLQAEGQACLRAIESIEPNDLYLFSAQQVLVSCYTLLLQLMPDCRAHATLAFKMPRPDYHARYAPRLPRCQFNAPFNELRVPASLLDVPLGMADRVSAQLSERACERELTHLQSQPHDALIRQVQALLRPGHEGYLSLDAMALTLNLSRRTLARQLQASGTSYRDLLLAAQRRDSAALLQDGELSLSEVARRLGYSSAGNFARAYKGWHGHGLARRRDSSVSASTSTPDGSSV